MANGARPRHNKPEGNSLDAIETGLKTFADRLDLMIREHGGEIPLAQKLGITQSAVDRWRHAIQFPRLRELINLVNKLSVSADWLIGVNMIVGGLDLERIRLILLEAGKSRLWGQFNTDEKFLFIRAIYMRFPAGSDPTRTQEIIERLVEQAMIKTKGHNPGAQKSTKP